MGRLSIEFLAVGDFLIIKIKRNLLLENETPGHPYYKSCTNLHKNWTSLKNLGQMRFLGGKFDCRCLEVELMNNTLNSKLVDVE